MAGALSGLRVIDCTHVIAGAWCSLLLADLGADVIKVEPPKGETTRGRADWAFKPFDFVNRNKRTIAVDTSKPEGADIIRKLAASADIFVENYRPGAMDRLGLGYCEISAINRRIIYASVSGFGQTGPYRNRGGLDLVAQAMSGIMSFTGERGSKKPVSAGVPLSDLNAGTFAALGVLAALNDRHRTGEGQHLETSLLESAMAYTMWETGMALTMGTIAERMGTRHRLAAPYEALKTSDGHLVVGVNTQKLWRRFCQALGEPSLADEPKFSDRYPRVDNRDALQARLEGILATDTTDNWVKRITAAGVPCGPINNIREALEDPHLAERGFLQEIDNRRFPVTPIKMSRSRVGIDRGVGAIGQHTRSILLAEGVTEAEIEALIGKGVIRA